jgi:Family of unknown function (DUF6325)
MSDDLDQAMRDLDHTGPIDYLIVEFPTGSRMTGEGLPLLVDLVDRRIIRLLDLLFVKKLPDGKVVSLDLKEVDDDGGLAVFAGASSGLLGEDDLTEAGNALEPGSAAAIIVYENLWAAPLARALRRAGAQLVAGGRIPVQGLLAALDAAEKAELQESQR